ncbi:MAG: peptidoglycan endopeptidase [Burkholderiaceae bacterium]|nr:peptidoglycan endopeptidase [Burkholderiaceae bacterium]
MPIRKHMILLPFQFLTAMVLGGFVLTASANTVADAVAKEALKPEVRIENNSSYFARFTYQVVDSVSTKTEALINEAMQLIGVRYRWNGDLPQSGLDASGFVRFVFRDKLGFLLPPKSSQMSKVGKPISRDELEPGDLVFFNTMRLTFSHVGIYVGDNKFIHSPSKGSAVRVDDLASTYWDKRFDGARRLDGTDELSNAERNALIQEAKKLRTQARNL